MTTMNLLAATWTDGVFVFSDGGRTQELAKCSVRALASARDGGALAIVDGHAVLRRSLEGEWTTILTSTLDLASLVVVGDSIFVGTDDARVLCIAQDGKAELLGGFEKTPGREHWYAGSVIVDGRVMGPPLGVRSMSATSDGDALLVNVHVGGIPRSTDRGLTWLPTIDIDCDVHQVCGHPSRPELAIAASAKGLCVSRDGGSTWSVEQEGLHASYCSAVAFCNDDMLVAASTDHFASRGMVYRRPIDGDGALEPLQGLPEWFAGIVDTGCIAALGSELAIVDGAGNLYSSTDAGRAWERRDQGLPMVSCLLARPGVRNLSTPPER